MKHTGFFFALTAILALASPRHRGAGGTVRLGVTHAKASQKVKSLSLERKVISLRCETVGCNSSKAVFGTFSDDRLWIRRMCRKCAKTSSKPIKRLSHACHDCTRGASFATPGSLLSSLAHCAVHREQGESDLRHARCSHAEGCSRRGVFGSADGKHFFCTKHKEPFHLDRVHKTCSIERCRLRALFGNASSGARFCNHHKQAGHRNLALRTCVADGCTSPAYYGSAPGLATACTAHRSEEDMDVVNKLCEARGCTRQAFYGLPAARRARFCARHRFAGHEQVRGGLTPLAAIAAMRLA